MRNLEDGSENFLSISDHIYVLKNKEKSTLSCFSQNCICYTLIKISWGQKRKKEKKFDYTFVIIDNCFHKKNVEKSIKVTVHKWDAIFPNFVPFRVCFSRSEK